MGKILGQRRLSMARFLVKYIPQKESVGFPDAKRRFALAKKYKFKRISEHSQNQAQSAAGSLQSASHMCPWLRPFWQASTRFPRTKKALAEGWRKIADYELGIWGFSLKIPTFRNAEIISRGPNKFGNQYRRVCVIPFRKGGGGKLEP